MPAYALRNVHKSWEADEGIRKRYRDHRRLFQGMQPADFDPNCVVQTAALNFAVLAPVLRIMSRHNCKLCSIKSAESELLVK